MLSALILGFRTAAITRPEVISKEQILVGFSHSSGGPFTEGSRVMLLIFDRIKENVDDIIISALSDQYLSVASVYCVSELLATCQMLVS